MSLEISDLTATLEEAGIVIVQYRFGSRRLDAVSEWIPGHPSIILMNVDESVPGDRYRWTLARELGHLILHRHPSKNMEDEANQFAAKFLMPAKELRSKLRNVRMHTLATLKAIWKVSMGALLERTKQIGSISATQYKYMRMNFSKVGYHIQEPPKLAIQIEIPTLMKDLISLHLNELHFALSKGVRSFAQDDRTGVFDRVCSTIRAPTGGRRAISADGMTDGTALPNFFIYPYRFPHSGFATTSYHLSGFPVSN